jgi:hypothetical protein
VGLLAARYPAPTGVLRGRRARDELPSPTFGADLRALQGYKAYPRHVRPGLKYTKPVNAIKSPQQPTASFVLPFDLNLHLYILWKLLLI